MPEAGLPEPLAVWDGHDRDWGRGWSDEDFADLDNWLQGQLGTHGRHACRVEVYLLDAPFAVVTRYRHKAGGSKYQDPETGKAAVDPPVTVPLTEMPPARLLQQER